ncbi:MAG: polyprenyl synthetase family protein [Cytophagales bacterium]|nr:MAG: polyprenyl synthetase family protein [Cytophagales bacterium]
MILSTNNILKKINTEINTFKYGSHPQNLYEPISYLMDLGGKRLRPMLVCYAYSLFENDISTIIKPSIAVEIFHNFTLMHDDIMDNAPLRRGKPTVHEKWNNNIAILSGDVMLVKAYQILETLAPSHFKKVFPAFNQCAAAVCEGQQLDMDFSQKKVISMDEYIEMIRLKTAVLLGFSLEMGAIIGNANDENIQHLKLFGEEIGIAFQIADDLLDAYGQADKFGKKVGGDIVENKKTFLSIKALEIASKSEQKLLENYFSDQEISAEQKIESVMKIYNSLNIYEITKEEINKYFESALLHLGKVKCDIFRKGLLKKFIAELMERQN